VRNYGKCIRMQFIRSEREFITRKGGLGNSELEWDFIFYVEKDLVPFI
jgi:hypothetical protein